MDSGWLPARFGLPHPVVWPAGDPPDRLCRWALSSLAAGLVALSVFLAARRVAGAFQRPLDAVALMGTALVVAGLSMSLRLLWRWSPSWSGRGWLACPMLWLPSAALLLIGASVTIPGSSLAALVAFWLVLLAEELVTYGVVMRRRHGGGSQGNRPEAILPPGDVDEDDARQPHAAGPQAHAAGRLAHTSVESLDDVSQQFTRRSHVDGGDCVDALLRGSFAPQQRSLSLHLAFCPPLSFTPHIETRQIDGAEVAIKLAQSMAYGARIDLRLRQYSHETESVLIELRARPPKRRHSGR